MLSFKCNVGGLILLHLCWKPKFRGSNNINTLGLLGFVVKFMMLSVSEITWHQAVRISMNNELEAFVSVQTCLMAALP